MVDSKNKIKPYCPYYPYHPLSKKKSGEKLSTLNSSLSIQTFLLLHHLVWVVDTLDVDCIEECLQKFDA